MRQQRSAIVDQMNEMVSVATKEGRGLNTEEDISFDKMDQDVRGLKASIDRLERSEDLKREMATKSEAVAERKEVAKVEGRSVYSKFLRHGASALNSEERSMLAEMRGTATQVVGTDSLGGYTVPESFSNALDIATLFKGDVEGLSQVINTSGGATLPYPKVDDTSVTGSILAEATAMSVSDQTFGVLNLGAYNYTSGIVKVSHQLLQDSAFNLDAYLAESLGNRIARAQNAHYTTGTGSSQPQGFITGGTSGVTAASATAVTAQEVLELIHSVDKSYRNSASFAIMANDNTVAALRKLGIGSSNDYPIFTPGLNGSPDRIFGTPIYVNNDMADIATGSKSIAAGDFSKFVVRNAGGIQMLRLNERYADELEVAFLAYKRSDAGVLNSAAIKYITQA